MEYIHNEENDIWGFPQKYKGIEFHPIKISDFLTKDLFYGIFCYPKEYIKEHIADENDVMKAEIKKAIKNGQQIHGAEITVNYNLQVK